MLVPGSGHAAESRERQCALLGASCAGQGKQEPSRGRGRAGLDGQPCSLRGITTSHGAGPWVVGSMHKWEAELFGPITSCLGKLLVAQSSDREQAAVGSRAQHWDRDRGAVQGLTGMTWCCWVQVRPFNATRVW